MLQVKHYGFSLKYFPIGRKNRLIQPPALSPNKNGIEWLKYKCPSDIPNFRCLLLKADFRIFCFGLETLLNKLVKLCSCFFRKIILNKTAECFIFIKKVNLFSNRPKNYLLSKDAGLYLKHQAVTRVFHTFSKSKSTTL